MEKKVLAWEPWFFMAFGLFHLHRIWGLIDRNSYAKFWIHVLKNKGLFYFVLMGILSILCILGIVTFIRICITTIGGDGYTYSAGLIYYLIYLLLQPVWSFGINFYYGCLI